MGISLFEHGGAGGSDATTPLRATRYKGGDMLVCKLASSKGIFMTDVGVGDVALITGISYDEESRPPLQVVDFLVLRTGKQYQMYAITVSHFWELKDVSTA
jgi:hypothetical protein